MAEAVVSIVVGRLTDLLIEEADDLLHQVRDEIQQVVTELTRMKPFLRDADSRINEPRVSILVAQVRELAYDAEHVVESFLLKASSTGKIIQWMNTRKFSRKIKDIQRKMSLLFNCFRDYNIRSTLESAQSSNFSYGTAGKLKRFYSFPTLEPEIFVGFHGDVDRLVGHLVDETDDCYPLIFICGMGGLGKTTLAQKIYNHSTIKAYFAGLAWVSISQKWQTKNVLQRIIVCLLPEKKEEILTWEVDKLVENLLQIQQSKKCLIVLDDIWSTDAWDSLKAAFPAEKCVSKLMLTSRNVDVAGHVNPKGFIHQPESLSAEQSWELLKLKALPRGGDSLDITRDVKRMEELGREMVAYCFGLPLAIVILGGILVTKPSLIEWEKVYHDSLLSLKRDKGFGDDYQRELFDVLVWSYNDLPPQLKPCFLYLGKFGEDEWIETETLYQLWIAEGMVLSSDKREGETMMQVAESYMGELVFKSMVQVRSNDMESSLTKFKSCSLHDLMRDLSLSQAKAEGFFEVMDFRKGNDFHLNPSTDFKSVDTRQLVLFSDKGHVSKKINPYFVRKANQYRSVIVFSESEGTRSLPRVLGSHVADFRLLRVFSMENVRTGLGTLFCINLGRVLGSLVYLRYLSVRRTHLLIFPSIQKLGLLETLKLDVWYNIYFPPWQSRNILEKLGRLQHLYLPGFKVHRLEKLGLLKHIKIRFNGLSKLETLENFDTRWCEVKDLPKLISLQKLRLRVYDNCSELEGMMKYLAAIALSSSSCLRYLGLDIRIDDISLGNGPDMLRQLLWDHNFKLHDLVARGKLPELGELFEQHQQLHNTVIDVSLIRITRIRLWNSLLEEDPMPVLEKIPTLRVLSLMNSAYVGKEMVCSAMGFPKLTYLNLDGLLNIVKWRVEEGSMPVLSFLRIAHCPKLEEVPEGLRFLNSLQTLNLLSMPSDFLDRVRMVNGEQGPDFYKVAHVPHLVLNYVRDNVSSIPFKH